MERKNYSSGSAWEEKAGYSRAVKVGPFIEIAGTTASDGNSVQCIGDAAGQTRYILQKFEQILSDMGAGLEHITRIRTYVSHIEDWEKVAMVHQEFLGDVKPAMTLVEAKFIHPDLLVEIEATAIVHGEL